MSLESIEKKLNKFGGGNADDYVDFFHLSNDGDTARVRFMHFGFDDLEENGIKIIHDNVEIGGSKRKVACLETGDCPLCAEHSRYKFKMYLQLIDEEDGELKVWERGKRLWPNVKNLIEQHEMMYKYPVEIVRHGKKGDTNTQYMLNVQFNGKELEIDEETKAKIEEQRKNIFGPEKANTVIERPKEDLIKMARGEFQFEGDKGKDNNSSDDISSDDSGGSSKSDFF